MTSNTEDQPLDLSMAGSKKKKKNELKTTPKADTFIQDLYKVGERLFDNLGNKYG